MKHSWFSFLIVAVLLGLLVLLAALQYRWLGQISDGERARLEKRLASDTQRFAEDFDREIQNACFTFGLDSDVWRERKYAAFTRRFEAWRQQTAYPALIREIYFISHGEASRYDFVSKTFVPAELSEDLQNELANSSTDFEPINEKTFTLKMPVYEAVDQIIIRPPALAAPTERNEKFGTVVIKLDEKVIKTEILPALARKYFSDNESRDYRLAVVSQADPASIVFKSARRGDITGMDSPDASAPLFNLSHGDFPLIINRDLISKIRKTDEPESVILTQTLRRKKLTGGASSEIAPAPETPTDVFKMDQLRGAPSEAPGPGGARIFRRERTGAENAGRWVLKVQHIDGSLEKFITNTRRRNLAVSFGILALLAASVVLIFLSARRAQMLAQKQLDFVSAVSHEFRTPLAVIYSAGENLMDGVVSSEKQITQYGSLIKREGKKLSSMVEQILEFAGARSGRKKYDMRQTDIGTVIEGALGECKSIIAEKGFAVEKEIAENLPKISADANALSHTIQNLIMNAVKYSDGNKWIKISAACGGGGRLKIAVEDKGIGIAPKDVSNIFTPFYRAKAVVDAQIHGNGLGLSLVKQTVEAHGGKISVETEAGKGSKFIIYLPVNI